MKNKRPVSNTTKNNWIMDAFLFMTAVVTSLSGIYFLFLPNAGYMGGRNPWYGITILFSRETWDVMHTWVGVGMVAVALIHLIFHWKWMVSMSKRMFSKLKGKTSKMSPKGRFNVLIDTLIALGFLVCAASGFYFLFAGSSHGGLNTDPMFLFSRTTWDLIHTWSGVVFIGAAVVHFSIHWGWVVKVTRKVFTRTPELVLSKLETQN